MTNTPLRNIRVNDDLWTALKVKAASEGRTVTAVLLDAIKRYVGVLVVAVLAVVGLSACGGAQDSPTPAAAERTAAVAPSVGVAATVEPSEAVSDCYVALEWGDPASWQSVTNLMGTNPELKLETLDALPAPSEGCAAADVASLQQAHDIADQLRTAMAAGQTG